MSEQNEINETSEDQDIKRWMAKRRAALVIQSLRGQTTVAEAERPHHERLTLSGVASHGTH